MPDMSNQTMIDVVLDKKLSEYNSNKDNFAAADELTVRITLNEYRELVSGVATKKSDIDAANKDKYTRENEIKTLTEENKQLKAENYELKKQVDELKEQQNELSKRMDELAKRIEEEAGILPGTIEG